MHAIRLAKDAWAATNEAEVVENVRTASMIARKSRGDIGICCGAVEDEPEKLAGDGALKATSADGSDEAGSVERGAIGTGTRGQSGIGTPPTRHSLGWLLIWGKVLG